MGTKINKYCEPFVGGGAVLFDMKEHNFDYILINDLNKDLINLYENIKNNVNELIEQLEFLEQEYLPMNTENRKIFYYDIRTEFNILVNTYNIRKSALFIFLNRTCFNGLFRVNSKNEFNVPMGVYKNPQILDENNLINVSKYLQNIDIKHGDYSNCIDFIDNKTFVYIDPPYRPITKTSSFTSYTNSGFNDESQIQLSQFINKLNDKGAKVMLSNSFTEDGFFHDLYSNYNIHEVYARRSINSDKNNRGKVTELLITNY